MYLSLRLDFSFNIFVYNTDDAHIQSWYQGDYSMKLMNIKRAETGDERHSCKHVLNT